MVHPSRICLRLLIACVALGLVGVAVCGDTAAAQRLRRGRRFAAVAARANTWGPRYYGPGFYPPWAAPFGIFAPLPFGESPPPVGAPLGHYPRSSAAGEALTTDDSRPLDNVQGALPDAPSSPTVPVEQAGTPGPQLRSPTNDELVPPEAVPPPAGELPSPSQRDRAARARRGVEF